MFVDLCQAAGFPVMCTSGGVWDLQRLEDDEVPAFGQALARDFFDRRGLKVVWAGDATSS